MRECVFHFVAEREEEVNGDGGSAHECLLRVSERATEGGCGGFLGAVPCASSGVYTHAREYSSLALARARSRSLVVVLCVIESRWAGGTQSARVWEGEGE